MATIISIQTNNTTDNKKQAQEYIDYYARKSPDTYINHIDSLKDFLKKQYTLTDNEVNSLDYHIVSTTQETAQAVAAQVTQNGVIDLDVIGAQLGLTGIAQDLTRSPLIGTGLTSAAQVSGNVVTPYNNSDMYKFNLNDAGLSEAKEIAPFLKRNYDVRPMYVQMVDSDFKSVGIGLSDGIVITSLKLNPNPTSINISSAKIINRYHTLTRWVEEHWGDEIDVVSANGSTYAFIAFATDGLSDAGLTVAQRDKTKAYLMLKELVKIFQTNGCIYQDSSTYEGSQFSPGTILSVTDLTATDKFLMDPTNSYFLNKHPREGMIKERLYINLYFDYLSVTGYFESFDILQEAGSPYKFTYSFVFKAEKTKYIQGASAIADAVVPIVLEPVPAYIPPSQIEEGVDINFQNNLTTQEAA
jgi:hypothetical protein